MKKVNQRWIGNRKVQAGIFACVFAFIGLYLMFDARASVTTVSFELENGVKSGSASSLNDTSAANSAAIKFGQDVPVASDNEFSFAVIPDTQQEVFDTRQAQYLVSGTNIYMNQYFNQRLQHLVENKSNYNLKYVFQVGDLVNWDTETHDQFVRASEGLKILERANIPYMAANGNHDNMATGDGGGARDSRYTRTYLRDVDTWNSYLPPSRFPGMKTFCGEFAQFNSRLMAAFPAGMSSTDVDHPQTAKNECAKANYSSVNAYRAFTAGGLKWIVINNEFLPRQVVQEWMKTVLERHADHNAIIVSHYNINNGGSLSTDGSYGSKQGSPKAVMDNVYRQYRNVKFVLSGHVGNTGYCSTATGVNGNIIRNYLNDRLSGDNAGNYFRLLKINVSGRTITSQHIMPNSSAASRTPSSPSTCNESNVMWIR